MIAPFSSYGCGSDSCVACSGDAEWQAQRVWVVTEAEVDPVRGRESSGVVVGLFHFGCEPEPTDDTVGYVEDGMSFDAWPHLDCDGCGGGLDKPVVVL